MMSTVPATLALCSAIFAVLGAGCGGEDVPSVEDDPQATLQQGITRTDTVVFTLNIAGQTALSKVYDMDVYKIGVGYSTQLRSSADLYFFNPGVPRQAFTVKKSSVVSWVCYDGSTHSSSLPKDYILNPSSSQPPRNFSDLSTFFLLPCLGHLEFPTSVKVTAQVSYTK